MKLLIASLAAFMLLAQTACVQKKQWQDTHASGVAELPIKHDLFTETPSLPSTSQLIDLDQVIQDDFFAYLNKPELALHSQVEKVGSYLSLLVDQFEYSEQTLTAQQIVDAKGGNCLSLTLLTTALAELAGLKVSYDLLDYYPSYSLDNNFLISADHMRAVLYAPQRSGDNGPGYLGSRITIDYFSTQGMRYTENVSSEYQLSLYYSNRAAELLVDNKDAAAFAFAKQALKMYANNASALNTMAIVHRRMGESEVAEAIYQIALERVPSQQALFYGNYVSLLERQGRATDLARVKKAYELVQQQHPVEWIRAGKKAHAEGDYELADRLYAKALLIAPDLHGVRLLRAQAKVAAGNTDEAKRELQIAIRSSTDQEQNGRYQRKLAKLNKLSRP